MTDTYVTVSPASLWSPRPVIYHAIGLWRTGPTDVLSGVRDGIVTSDALTVCGTPHYQSTWRVEGGCVVVGSDSQSASWPQIHLKHARRIGRPCARCFPGDDQ